MLIDSGSELSFITEELVKKTRFSSTISFDSVAWNR